MLKMQNITIKKSIKTRVERWVITRTTLSDREFDKGQSNKMNVQIVVSHQHEECIQGK